MVSMVFVCASSKTANPFIFKICQQHVLNFYDSFLIGFNPRINLIAFYLLSTGTAESGAKRGLRS